LCAPATVHPARRIALQFQGMIAEYERAQFWSAQRRGKRHRAPPGRGQRVLTALRSDESFLRKTISLLPRTTTFNEEQARVVGGCIQAMGSFRGSQRAIARLLNEPCIPNLQSTRSVGSSTVWGLYAIRRTRLRGLLLARRRLHSSSTIHASKTDAGWHWPLAIRRQPRCGREGIGPRSPCRRSSGEESLRSRRNWARERNILIVAACWTVTPASCRPRLVQQMGGYSRCTEHPPRSSVPQYPLLRVGAGPRPGDVLSHQTDWQFICDNRPVRARTLPRGAVVDGIVRFARRSSVWLQCEIDSTISPLHAMADPPNHRRGRLAARARSLFAEARSVCLHPGSIRGLLSGCDELREGFCRSIAVAGVNRLTTAYCKRSSIHHRPAATYATPAPQTSDQLSSARLRSSQMAL